MRQSSSTSRTRTSRLTSAYLTRSETAGSAGLTGMRVHLRRFMWTLHTANAEHWVPVQTVTSFKRMREFQPLGKEWIVGALRTSEELEVDEAGENIRRRTEVQPPKGQFERSVYAVRRRLVYQCGYADDGHAVHGRKGLGRRSLRCRRSWRSSSTSTARRTRCG